MIAVENHREERPSGNVFSLFEGAASLRPERPFLIAGGQTLLTYGGMLTETGKAGAWLRSLNVDEGDRVLAQVHKSPVSVILYLACLRAGAVFIPLNTAYQERELDYFLSDADPALLVASPDLPAEGVAFAGHRVIAAANLEDAPWQATQDKLITCVRESGDAAAILYTSGTTGRSKGAILTHGNLASNVKALNEAWRWREEDALLHALPTFHAHGLFVALHCAMLGASSILFHERFDATAVIGDLPRATVFMGVPTFYTRLLAEPSFDKALCENMRLFVSGSAPLLEATFDEFRKRTGHIILERYGMTEALMVTSNPYDGPRIPGSVGPALPGVTVRIVDADGRPAQRGEPGVLEIKGPNLFAGYWRNPEKTAEDHTQDGFFISGDIATQDEAGFIRIVGRAKDLIISGGYNVYPKEIELAIDALEGVEESAVFGVPHSDFGEGVVAAVTPMQGVTLDPAHIRDSLHDGLAAFKRPKHVVIVDTLPRNAMGKVQKAQLREVYKGIFNKST